MYLWCEKTRESLCTCICDHEKTRELLCTCICDVIMRRPENITYMYMWCEKTRESLCTCICDVRRQGNNYVHVSVMWDKIRGLIYDVHVSVITDRAVMVRNFTNGVNHGSHMTVKWKCYMSRLICFQDRNHAVYYYYEIGN